MSKYSKLPDHSSHSTVQDEDDIELGAVESNRPDAGNTTGAYEKLNASVGDATSNTSGQPNRNPTAPNAFKLRVLNKEAVIEIFTLTGSSTILHLKQEIMKQTNVDVDAQRLIFSGKALRPDESTLASFNIGPDSTVHLFPKPANAISSSVSTSGSVGQPEATTNPLHLPSSSADRHILLLDDDPQLNQSASEVRLWSTILIFLSILTVFDNFNRAVATGTMWYRC